MSFLSKKLAFFFIAALFISGTTFHSQYAEDDVWGFGGSNDTDTSSTSSTTSTESED